MQDLPKTEVVVALGIFSIVIRVATPIECAGRQSVPRPNSNAAAFGRPSLPAVSLGKHIDFLGEHVHLWLRSWKLLRGRCVPPRVGRNRGGGSGRGGFGAGAGSGSGCRGSGGGCLNVTAWWIRGGWSRGGPQACTLVPIPPA